MTDTLGYILKRVAAGDGGDSDLFTDYRALASATGLAYVVSPLNHLGIENGLRSLYTGPGFVGTKALRAASVRGAGVTDPPEVYDIDWRNPIDQAGDYTGRVSLRLGTHWITTPGAGLAWPKAVLKCRVKAPATYTVGLYFAVTPARQFPTVASHRANWVVTNTSYDDVTLTIALQDNDVRRVVTTPVYGAPASGPATVGETVALGLSSFWFGAYCSSDGAADGAIAGISLYLTRP